jgi:hypothetical protein
MLFRMGILYERITSIAPFRSLRGSILCVFQKPAESGGLAANAQNGELRGQRVGVS